MIKATKTHVVAVLQGEVAVMDKRDRQWSTVQFRMTEQATGLWTDEHSFLVYSQHSLELFKYGERGFVSTVMATLSDDISHLAYFGSTLMAVSSSDECTFYHISTAGQLIPLYSFTPLCHVTEIAINFPYAFFRCDAYIQIVSPSMRRRSARIGQIQRTHSGGALLTAPGILVEVYCSEEECRKTTWFLDSIFPQSVPLMFEVLSDGLLPSSQLPPGELKVKSAGSDWVTITLNVALISFDEISLLVPPNRVIEVPWDQTSSLPLSALFSGNSLIYHAAASAPIGLQVVNSQHSVLKLPTQSPEITIAAELSCIFSFMSSDFIVTKFECSSHRCFSKSEETITLSHMQVDHIASLEVLFATESLVFLQVTCWEYRPHSSIGPMLLIVVYDSESKQVECVQRWTDYQAHSSYHIIQVSKVETRVFFYLSILRMCTAIGKTFTCAEVNEPGLEAVTSVSSEQLSPHTWSVYFLTDSLALYRYSLAGSLRLEGRILIVLADISQIQRVELIGNKVAVMHRHRLEVYALPSFTLLLSKRINASRILFFRSSTTDASRYIGMTYDGHSLKIMEIGFQNGIDFILASAYLLQFTSPTDIVYYQNGNIYMMKLVQAELMLHSNESAVETVESEVTITAANAHNSANCTLLIVRTGKKDYSQLIAVVAVAVLVAIVGYVGKDRKKQVVPEVEMKEFH